jgi:hypothetical protein
MTTIVATADTFVSLRRIFFIEVILFPAAIFLLVTVAHASEQRREGSAGCQEKPIRRLRFECSPRKFSANIPTFAQPAELYPRVRPEEHNP